MGRRNGAALARVDHELRARLKEAARGEPPHALRSALEGWLRELDDAAAPSTVDDATEVWAVEAVYRATMHELRSLMSVVDVNLRYGRSRILESLALFVGRRGQEIVGIIELQDALDDAILACDQAVTVARDGVDAARRPTESHASLVSTARLAARVMSRGRGRLAPVEVGTLPDVHVRPSSGELTQVLVNLIRVAQDQHDASAGEPVRMHGWASSTMAFVELSTPRDASAEGVSSDAQGPHGQRRDELRITIEMATAVATRWGGTVAETLGADGMPAIVLGIPREAGATSRGLPR